MGVVILGGGISGLTSAFYLRQAGYKSSIKILEATDRIGGWINSHMTENGTLFELGPRTLRAGGNAGANTLLLAESLDLGDKILSVDAEHPSSNNRMIQVDGKLHTLPDGFLSIFKKSSPFSKSIFRQCFLKDIMTKKFPGKDESLYGFTERRLGKEVASYLMDPIARGIFAGDAKQLSVLALARPLYEAEQKHGSIIKGMLKHKREMINIEFSKSVLANKSIGEKWTMWSLQGGLETLVKTLRDYLERNNVEILKNEFVENISYKNRELYITANGRTMQADHAVSSLPAFRLKDAISSIDGSISSILDSIPYVTVALVSLEFDSLYYNKPAFGYLVPSSEPSKLLGVIFDTCTFPQGKKHVLTVMMGGHAFEKYFDDDVSNETYYEIALEEVKRALNITDDPSNYKVSIMKKCIPQYTIGHYERMKEMERLTSVSSIPIHLAGNYINGVGVNDSIYRSRQLIHSLSPILS